MTADRIEDHDDGYDLEPGETAGWADGPEWQSPPDTSDGSDTPLGAPDKLLMAIRTGAWLDEQTFPPLRYAVPGLIPEGFTLLIGPPKAGKSWLVLLAPEKVLVRRWPEGAWWGRGWVAGHHPGHRLMTTVMRCRL
jgi:hypothetical protein